MSLQIASTKPVAIITGAGSGIGRAAAVMLGKFGYNVGLVGRRIARLKETAQYLPDGIEHLKMPIDVGEASCISDMIEQIVEHFGRLDVLINNAGIAPKFPIDQTSPDVIDKTYRVNALAPAYAIAKAWPIFIRQNAYDGSRGCIINISTLGTADPFPGFFAYASSKASVNSMVKSCAKEGTTIGMRAFAIAPGAVETQMLRALFDETTIPPVECLSPDDVATVIIECVSGQRDDQNGETIFLSNQTLL
jgi:NAD(P)-dependent dehydrogenase (short-subunit alcohol dehydrogenase family)